MLQNAPSSSLRDVILALLRFCRIVVTPTLALSSRIAWWHWLRSFPRLRNATVRPSIVRVLSREVHSGRGFVQESGAWRGPLPAETCLLLDRAVMLDQRFQEEQLLLARDKDDAAAGAEPLAVSIAAKEAVEPASPQRAVLISGVSRLRNLYLAKAQLLDRATTPCTASEQETRLRTLWTLLRPGQQLESLKTKQWQDIGFQGASPETDFRAAGLLGLDCLLAFAESDSARAQQTIEESVHTGTDAWYSFAIASIAITRDIVLCSLRSGQLDLILLRHSQRIDDIRQAFLAVHVAVLRLFHRQWLALQDHRTPAKRPTVMQFEGVLKAFRASLLPWLERGLIAAWVYGHGIEEEPVEVST